ncbi:hypothetical protein [Mangrovimonas xylaniphaga]|uniref:hypothetical protein n=1 Tax=Mangrovimonas xylaniphaga TaxID=1645915 RepID=UPI0006B61A25|nr:hypothetical protein [Mangrovimonas xylaniphaga]
MKNTLKIFSVLLLFIVVTGCSSSIKVLDSWKSDNVAQIKDNNVLVIARTDNNQARIAFERDIADKLISNGIKATPSYSVLPSTIKLEEKHTEVELENFKTFLKNEGYNAVVLTVIKDYQEASKTYTDGGYYAGATYPSYYPGYYGGFYGYYMHPMSYSTYGSYTPMTSTTVTQKTFILETVAYDLDQPDGKQLVAVVTTKIEDPQSVTKNAEKYTEEIAKALK